MTFSLQTLLSSTHRNVSVRTVVSQGRVTRELTLLFSALLLALWAVALLSYAPADRAWSTTGADAAVHNWLGVVGAWLADLSYFLLGFSVWWLWVAGMLAWLRQTRLWLTQVPPAAPSTSRVRKPVAAVVTPEPRLAWVPGAVWWVALLGLLCASTALEWTRLYRWDSLLPDQAGGVLGYALGRLATVWLGDLGSVVGGMVLGIICVAVVLGFSWGQIAERIGQLVVTRVQLWRSRREQAADQRIGEASVKAREVEVDLDPVVERAVPISPVTIEPALIVVPQSERVAKESQQALFDDGTVSPLPQVSLLDKVPPQQETVSAETLEMTSRLIEKKLADFGVEVHVVAAAPGPVITRYEIEPATGVKGSQIVNLARDLARSLSLVSIRVIETIPGKNFMALELPNARRQMIRLSEILGSSVYNDAKSMLTVALGKDIVGKPVVADLAKMPHCLVAGTTGSGKSVGINAMILSLLYKADPQDVRLLLIDPKMLEMSVYEGIPHLLAPVVTDMRQAAHGLNWCVAEMEKRYKLMSKMGVRNIASYNQKIKEATARGELVPNPFSLTPEEPEPLHVLPQIVVVIDELADLMMVVGKKIEELIARLAQKARAAGIHLILATQRPSVDVITGLIKANIPTRMSFQVSSKIDSRTILDQMGAESLLGMGDMLYLPAGTGFPQRVHGAFVSDEEVHRVVDYLKENGEANYIDGVLEGGTVDGADGTAGGDEGGEKDPMYDQAVEVVLKHRKASISLVQRHLKIGYNRAARMLEEMENAGVVSTMGTNGQRDIMVPAREE
jgi:DNA segregation ATPase FtsK/SpoIIIE, S-DNA-T family